MIRTGIVDNSDYKGAELLRLLLNHPEVEIVFVNNRRHAHKQLAEVHPDLYGETELTYTDALPLDRIDLLFLCLHEGEARRLLEQHPLPEQVKVIDLSAGYRIADTEPAFVYGLPELNRRAICAARYVACPGALATGTALALLPLAKHLMLNHTIHVHTVFGTTQSDSMGTPPATFSQQSNNLNLCNPFVHPELPEVHRSLLQLQQSFRSELLFLPMQGGFSRGVFTTVYTQCAVGIEEVRKIYASCYDDHSFMFITDKQPELKQVINTNRCMLHLQQHDGWLLITTVIDNLLKGSAGQAVHNMNLQFNLQEEVGLHLKASVY